MRNFKIWTVSLSIVMVLSFLLAACGSKSANDSSNSAGATASPAASATAAPQQTEPVKIRLFTYGTENDYNWSQTIAAFEKAYPDIQVEVITLSDKGDTQESMKKLDLAAASGEAMDVVMFSDPAGYAQHVGLGMVAPLDEFISKEGFNLTDEYKVDTHLNGKIYALPGKFNPWYVLLNKTMLDAKGLKVPTDWTWADFEDYAAKLTSGSGADKVYGTYFHGPQNGGWMEYLKLMMENQPQNPEFLKADGSSNLADPNFQKTLELRQRMEKAGTVVPYTDVISQKLAYRDEFYHQKAAMLVIGSWMNTMLGGNDQYPLNFEVAVAPFPKNNPGDQSGYTPVTTDYVAMAEVSKHKEEAYKFIRWYTTEGQIVQGKNVPSWNKVSAEDLSKIIDTILSGTANPEKVDKASLVSTLANSRAPEIIPPVTYQAEVYKAIDTEFQKFILGKQDLATTVKNCQEQTQKIIDSNKK
ncbi:MAG TPA: sugar ABC transporter substrate-binding protein [Bacilli bacterium]